jgi:L-rhamnose-H+ transport protein
MAIVLSTSPISALAFPFILGMLWGVGSVLFGLSVERIGVALTYSLIIGLTATLGSLLPLLLATSLPSQRVLMLFLAGILIMTIGLTVSAFAGMKREIQQKSRGFKLGLLIAVISGMTSPMLNMGFVYGRPILETAQALGIPEELSTLPVWIVVLLGGFSINFGYAAYLLLRRKTFILFAKNTRLPLLLSITSGIIFFSGLAIYGAASSLLNALGTSVGWALLMSLMIVVSNISSILTGEWKGSKRALRYQLTSILILILGISIMGTSFYL